MLRRYLTPRDPRQAKFLTSSSLRWVLRNRAFTPHYLVRYARFFAFKLRNPHIVTRGFVFLGKDIELTARPGHGRLVLGRWAHIGDRTCIRAHEGTVEIGDKVVFGRDNVVNGYLDISIGESTLIADWIYICDFDHKFDQLGTPIKDQGIAKLPVRIGPDCWLGTKVSVLRGTETGRGCVFAAHTVVRGDIPDYSVVAGVPGRVIKSRLPVAPTRSGDERPVGAPEIRPTQRRVRPDEVDDQ
ncbi:acyltransferase [Epidermidibacterium keratini]|uniref:Acyltransferase n=1 Tax=Epidermidibacterium keratini TaxID=1891644 RepID=A0A7L4YRS8_9ACTN|nr:acyltransferase [Epidermidibacterium keratini]QHC01758.1 acyltransferase [Epidermidibacterium keratini]